MGSMKMSKAQSVLEVCAQLQQQRKVTNMQREVLAAYACAGWLYQVIAENSILYERLLMNVAPKDF